jgi:excisionase family DNA binding protein
MHCGFREIFEFFDCVLDCEPRPMEQSMGNAATVPIGPVLPSGAEVEMARGIVRKIAAGLGKGDIIKLQFGDTADAEPIQLPPLAARLVLDLLEELARGNAVSLTTLGPEVTTQEAADLLNISRPTLIQLLDDGRIPYHRLGTHRRIPLEGVLTFKTDLYAKRKTALDEMSAIHQEFGLE